MRTITVYSTDIDSRQAEIARELRGEGEGVSAERLERAKRFYRIDDARRCIAAELLRNHALLLETGRNACELRTAQDANGKPFLADLPGVHFNLSHSGKMVLCSVDSHAVGVDVEKIRPIDPDVAASCFTAEERKRLKDKEGTEWRNEFYRLWTLKESYLKMLGTGLHRDPLSVEIAPVDQHALCWKGEDDYTMQVLPAPEGYAAAVCGMGEFAVNIVEWWDNAVVG